MTWSHAVRPLHVSDIIQVPLAHSLSSQYLSAAVTAQVSRIYIPACDKLWREKARSFSSRWRKHIKNYTTHIYIYIYTSLLFIMEFSIRLQIPSRRLPFVSFLNVSRNVRKSWIEKNPVSGTFFRGESILPGIPAAAERFIRVGSYDCP